MDNSPMINAMYGEETTAIDDILTPYSLLKQGKAPGKGSLLEEMSVGINFITDFWREKYLQEYIRRGGSKIKFVTGQGGSGKTHLLELMSVIAEKENYITAHFSAYDIWVHDFKEIYLEIFRQSNIVECLMGCGNRIVTEMGFDYKEIPQGMTFMDYLSQHDLGDAITKREIRNQLKAMFLENPLIDNNFALACSLITGGFLGHPLLEEQNKELLLSWLQGDKSVKLSALRALGLSPARITKFNARHMLRSLSEVIRLAGYSGLFITIDNLEILISRSSLQPIRYTKLRREDTYESIRQLVDDIDSLKNIMFIFAFDRELLDNDNAGIKSYQALWMRIQNEIIGERFNRFTDIVDLDRLAAQEYTPRIVMEMSERLSEICSAEGINAKPIDCATCEKLIEQARMGSVSLPRLINRDTLGGGA
ncbi:MAG: BREX system ATP-binding domain-containing protein [Lachnospiraceae bacterium]